MKNKCNMRVLVIIIIFLILLLLTILNKETEDNKDINVVSVVEQPTTIITTATTTVNTNKRTKWAMTHYGYDCKGCSGKTASGYNVKNTIYYRDSTYGKVRIVAAPKNIALYSILQIKTSNNTYYAIVLDRGSAIKGNKIDLLVENEKQANKLGIIKNVEIEILRSGKR